MDFVESKEFEIFLVCSCPVAVPFEVYTCLDDAVHETAQVFILHVENALFHHEERR